MWTVLTTFIRIFGYSKPFHPKPNTKAESFFRNFLSLKLISNISGSLNDGHILNWLWLACWLLITSAMAKDISRDISKDLELKLQRQIWDILQGVSSRVVYLTKIRSPLSRSHHYAQLGNTLQKHFFCSFFFKHFSALIMVTWKGSAGRFFYFSTPSQNFTEGLNGPICPNLPIRSKIGFNKRADIHLIWKII